MAPMNPRLLRPTRAKAPPPPPPPSTLYFNNDANDGDWANLANWWSNPGQTIPATFLPTASTNVVISASVSGNSGDAAQCLNMTTSGNIGTEVNVYGLATFTGYAELLANINGAALFTEDSRMNGNVSVSATFVDSACHVYGSSDVFDPSPPPSCP